MTEHVAVLGWPVEHSVSPAMHNAAFQALGLDWQYDRLAVPPSQLEAEIRRLIGAGYRGFNVTVPHKQAAFRLRQVKDISPAARAIGAANTLTVRPDGALHADNTDWQGICRDWTAHGVTVQGATCLVLGTGGSARAVFYALHQLGAGTVQAVSRRPDSPAEIGYGDLAVVAFSADMIVNCTPIGMSPQVDESPWPDDVPFPAQAVLYDLIYNPPVTRLMEQAAAAGARAIGGLGMLVWQGALAFEQWTGMMPPVDVMHAAARDALKTKE